MSVGSVSASKMLTKEEIIGKSIPFLDIKGLAVVFVTCKKLGELSQTFTAWEIAFRAYFNEGRPFPEHLRSYWHSKSISVSSIHRQLMSCSMASHRVTESPALGSVRVFNKQCYSLTPEGAFTHEGVCVTDPFSTEKARIIPTTHASQPRGLHDFCVDESTLYTVGDDGFIEFRTLTGEFINRVSIGSAPSLSVLSMGCTKEGYIYMIRRIGDSCFIRWRHRSALVKGVRLGDGALFHKADAALSLNEEEGRVRPTCMGIHSEILFLGYTNGRVLLYERVKRFTYEEWLSVSASDNFFISESEMRTCRLTPIVQDNSIRKIIPDGESRVLVISDKATGVWDFRTRKDVFHERLRVTAAACDSRFYYLATRENGLHILSKDGKRVNLLPLKYSSLEGEVCTTILPSGVELVALSYNPSSEGLKGAIERFVFGNPSNVLWQEIADGIASKDPLDKRVAQVRFGGMDGEDQQAISSAKSTTAEELAAAIRSFVSKPPSKDKGDYKSS